MEESQLGRLKDKLQALDLITSLVEFNDPLNGEIKVTLGVDTRDM